MTEHTAFSVSMEKRHGIVRLVMCGELDMITTPDFVERLVEAEQELSSAILIDLRDVTYMDSTGLKAFLDASNRSRSARHLLLIGVQPALRRVFEVTGTTFLLDDADAVTLYTEFSREAAAAFDTSPQRQESAHD